MMNISNTYSPTRSQMEAYSQIKLSKIKMDKFEIHKEYLRKELGSEV